MPWGPSDASKYTKLATTEQDKWDWATTANAALKEYNGDDGKAIKVANAMLRKKKRRII